MPCNILLAPQKQPTMDRRNAGIKFIIGFVIILVLSAICAFVIVTYFPNDALPGLLFSAFIAVPAVSFIALGLMFKISWSDIKNFIWLDEDEFARLIIEQQKLLRQQENSES